MEQDKSFNVAGLVTAEEELQQLKKEYGMEEKESLWKRIISAFVDKKASRAPVTISKKKYCLATLFGGWAGVHNFMVGKKGMGVIYLALSFTGFSIVMSILDLWYALFLKTDDAKCITI